MKKRILTVLVAILMVIPFVLITPKANSFSTHSNTTVTSYGQYYYSSGYNEELISYAFGVEFSIPIQNSTYFTFTYELKDVYNGFINLSITAPTSFAWNTTYFYCEGCTLTQTPNMSNVSKTKTFQLQFRDSNKIQFTVIHDTSAIGSGTVVADTTFYNYTSSAYTSCSITGTSFILQPDVPDLVDNINNQIDLYLPGMSTSLSHIDSDLDNINQNIQALSPYIDQLEGYVDGLENYLNTLVNLSHYNIDSNAYPMYFLGALDGYIDTSYNWVSTVYGIAPTLHITSQRTTYNQSFNVEIQPQQSLYMIYYSNYPSNQFYYLTSGGTRLDGTVTTLQSINGFRLFLIEFKNTVSSNSIYPSLCNSFPTTRNNSFIPLYMGYHIPSDLADRYNLEIDNTYTRLLQSINNGIGALNDDYDTSAYDNYEQTLDSLNDSLRGRFDNVDDTMQNNVNTLFTPSGTAGSDGSIFEKFNFNGVNSLFTGILNGIFTSFPAFKYILLFALLLLVIGVMV